MLTLIQFGLNTADMAASLRLYSEAFGFQNAGGQGFWGESIKVQGLPPDSRSLIWWMVGAQELFQLEFFQHTRPTPRPLPEGWRPCDHGWVRFGVAIPDFNKCAAAITTNGLSLASPPIVVNGHRRAAMFDPYVGAFIEIREDLERQGPSAIYAASSVSDLDAARSFYGELLGFPLCSRDLLRRPEDEAMWGLANAKSDGFLVDTGNGYLEIVRYDDPVGRPRREDRRASDQGFGNVAFGARQKATISAALERLIAGGVQPTSTFQTDDLLAAYIIDPERETELAVIPEELDSVLGFSPLAPFFG